MLMVSLSLESSVSSLAEDQEVVDTADVEDQEVDIVVMVEVVDTVEDHRQVVLVEDTVEVLALESHLVEDTVEVLLLEEVTAEDHRQVVLVVDTRVDRTEVLDIVVLRAEAMEVMHSATMVDLVHLAVSTLIVHVHHAENSSSKNPQAYTWGFFMRDLIILEFS
jgi:hypothetical protein